MFLKFKAVFNIDIFFFIGKVNILRLHNNNYNRICASHGLQSAIILYNLDLWISDGTLLHWTQA